MQAPAKKPLTLIGGSARAAAVSAVRAGFDVSALDRFGDVDLRALCRHWLPLTEPRLLAEQVAAFPPAPVVPLGGCEHLASWMERAAADGALCGADARQFHRSQDPATLRLIARQAGVRFPLTHPNPHPDGVGEPADADGWLVKRQVRCGGSDVRRWDGRWPPPAGHHLQQRVRGRCLGASYLAAPDATVLLGVCAALRCNRAPSPFIYAGSLGPLPLEGAFARQLQRLGQVATEQLGLRGLFNADLVRTRSGEIYLLEINPRYTASMELLEDSLVQPQAEREPQRPAATLMAAHVAAVAGTRAMLPPAPRLARCKRIVYAPHDLRFNSGSRAVDDRPGAAGVLCDLPVVGSQIRRGQPVLTCLAEAPTLRAAARRAAQLADEVLRRCPADGAEPTVDWTVSSVD